MKSDCIDRLGCHLVCCLDVVYQEESPTMTLLAEALVSPRRVVASVWAQTEDLVKIATFRLRVRGFPVKSELSKFVCKILIRVHTGRGVT